MLSLLGPYKYLILGGVWLASIVGASAFWGHHVSLSYEVAIADQKAQAGLKLAEAYASKAKREQEDAETSRKIDETHAIELAAAHSGHDAFARQLRLERRRACGGDAGTAKAINPGKPENAPGSGDVGLGQVVVEDPILQARDGVKTLVAFTKACQKWASEVGR